MIKLATFNGRPKLDTIPHDLNDFPGIIFHVNKAGGEKCEADYFATPPPPDDWFGPTELTVVFAQEVSEEKIEELRQFLEVQINGYHDGCTWFVQIAQAVVNAAGDSGYPIKAHSSYVPD